jgi:hypothetical protein
MFLVFSSHIPKLKFLGCDSLYWFGQKCPYVLWILLLLVLPCTEVLIVGVTRFREMEQIPSLLAACECQFLVSGECFQ